MEAVSAISQSIEAMNQVLQMATQLSTETAEKMVKVNVEMSLAAQPGVGEVIDTVA
jgi:hypothetical protein